MVDDLQMGIRLVDRPEIEEVFQYARLLPEENHLRVARCSREKEHCTAAKEDLDADGGPFNIHTLFQQSRPPRGVMTATMITVLYSVVCTGNCTQYSAGNTG
jgi:hypothetical protein